MKIHCASWFIETLPYAKGCQIDRYIWSEIIESLGMYLDDVSKSFTQILLDLVRWNLAVPCNSFLIPRNTNSFDLLVLLLNLFSICFRVGIQPWLAILQSLGMVGICTHPSPFQNSVSNKYQQNTFCFDPNQKLGLKKRESRCPATSRICSFSSESIFSLKPLLSPEPSVADRIEWM